MEDPCKCEARLVFQKQTQATLQQLTAKHILPVVSDVGFFTVNILASIFQQALCICAPPPHLFQRTVEKERQMFIITSSSIWEKKKVSLTAPTR